MVEGGPGPIRLWTDLSDVPPSLAETLVTNSTGDFYTGGESREVATAGVGASALLSGVADITTDATDADTVFVGTPIMFDVGLMGTLVLETRVQLPDLDTKEIFIGFTSILAFDHQLADSIVNSSATVITLVAENCGFYFSDELTASATEWHGIYNGGSATASTTVADVNLGTTGTANPTAGEWQILKLEIDTNGTARWFIDGVLMQTVKGAVSTTTNFAAFVGPAANSANAAIIQSDYVLVKANRDWTV